MFQELDDYYGSSSFVIGKAFRDAKLPFKMMENMVIDCEFLVA